MSIILVNSLASCGSENLAKGRVEEDTDDKITYAMNNDDFDTAITLLEQQIESYPEEYQRFALLGAAYAARAGVSILAMVKAQFSSGSTGSGGSSLVSQLSSFIPTTPTAQNLSDLKTGLDRLQAIPAAERAEGTEEKYGQSASFQLTLYSAAYSVMYMSQFTSAVTGDFDPAKVATMSDADVENILDALILAAASGTGPAAGLGDVIDEALVQIEQQPGSTTREKMVNYMNTTGNAPALNR